MDWSSTQIGWDTQVAILWVVLPPIFIACGFLTMLLPKLLHQDESHRGGEARVLSQTPACE